MTFLALVVILGAVLVGVGATIRFAPPLAPTREGRLLFWIVANLVGAAAGLIADHIWVAARTLDLAPGLASGALPSVTESVIVATLGQILLEGGVLLALAAIVYVLGPRVTARGA
jgi:hypothetical protein